MSSMFSGVSVLNASRREQPLREFVCDISLVCKLRVNESVVPQLSGLVATAWRFGAEASAEELMTCWSPATSSLFARGGLLEMQTSLTAMVAAVSSFKTVPFSEYVEDCHENLRIPPLPFPTWPWRAIRSALETVYERCNEQVHSYAIEEVSPFSKVGPIARLSESSTRSNDHVHSTPNRRQTRLSLGGRISLSDSRRIQKPSLSSDRRKKRRTSEAPPAVKKLREDLDM